jgi:hypothetical protein
MPSSARSAVGNARATASKREKNLFIVFKVKE